MKFKFKDEGKHLYDFLFEFFVQCPQCNKFAILKSFPDEKGRYLFYARRTLVCNNCGYMTTYKDRYGAIGSDYPLWLKAKCCGEILWAYNLNHLNYIENFVKAELREREKTEYGWTNHSMVSRLPKWLKEAKNREKIIKCIEKMKKTIPQDVLNS